MSLNTELVSSALKEFLTAINVSIMNLAYTRSIAQTAKRDTLCTAQGEKQEETFKQLLSVFRNLAQE